MTEKKAQHSSTYMFLAVITPKTAMDIVEGFCASAAKADTPIPSEAHEKITFFKNRGAHYTKDDRQFAALFSAIALYADASTNASRPTESTMLYNGRLAREKKIYGVSPEQSSPRDALRQVDETLTHTKQGKTRIARDAQWLEDAIQHARANYNKSNRSAWVGIVTRNRETSDLQGNWARD